MDEWKEWVGKRINQKTNCRWGFWTLAITLQMLLHPAAAAAVCDCVRYIRVWESLLVIRLLGFVGCQRGMNARAIHTASSCFIKNTEEKMKRSFLCMRILYKEENSSTLCVCDKTQAVGMPNRHHRRTITSHHGIWDLCVCVCARSLVNTWVSMWLLQKKKRWDRGGSNGKTDR